jgi:hypothetical protein
VYLSHVNYEHSPPLFTAVAGADPGNESSDSSATITKEKIDTAAEAVDLATVVAASASGSEECGSTPEIKITESENDEDLCSLNSSEISAVETVLFEASSRRESEYHVYGLVCEQKYSAVMVYYRQQHLTRWIPNAHANEKKDAEIVDDILTLYCQILAERGESKSRKRNGFSLSMPA